MKTGLERIAAKARREPKLRFTSLAHHITRQRVWGDLCHIPNNSAPGVDGQTVPEAKQAFDVWIEPMIQSIHRKGYHAPPIRRVYIPKPGKQEKRPLGVPCVADRALQRSTAQVLSAIYEQDFLACSFGGRPGQGAHHALSTLNEVIAGKKVGWILEADLNLVLLCHYAYYGIGGNFRCLQRVHRAVERYWYKMLCSRSRKGYFPWFVIHRIKASYPIVRPRLFLPYKELKAIAML